MGVRVRVQVSLASRQEHRDAQAREQYHARERRREPFDTARIEVEEQGARVGELSLEGSERSVFRH